jgi:glutamyl-tRNA reductase
MGASLQFWNPNCVQEKLLVTSVKTALATAGIEWQFGTSMKTLIVGIGALGGLIAARLRAAGLPVWLATRDAEQADKLRASGLRVTGMGGAATVQTTTIAPFGGLRSG